MRMILLASLAPFALVATSPAIAAETDIPSLEYRQNEGYERLYRVLISDPGDLGARRLAQIMVEVITAQQPIHTEIEAENPGFLAALEQELMPLVTRYMVRVRDLHEDDFYAAVTPLLSAQEALEVAEFYESDMGQNLLRAARANYQLAMTAEQLARIDEEDLTREDAERSVAATTDVAMRQISEAEQEAVNDYLMANPRLLENILILREPVLTIRVAMDNEEMTGEEEALFTEIYTRVLARYGY